MLRHERMTVAMALAEKTHHSLSFSYYYERWAGERLVLEKAFPGHRRPGRSISVSAVPFGPGIDG